mgnify:CR=1 FL=1
MSVILEAARAVLEAEAANRPTPTAFMIGPAAMRNMATMAAHAPDLARLTLDLDALTDGLQPIRGTAQYTIGFLDALRFLRRALRLDTPPDAPTVIEVGPGPFEVEATGPVTWDSEASAWAVPYVTSNPGIPEEFREWRALWTGDRWEPEDP